MYSLNGNLLFKFLIFTFLIFTQNAECSILEVGKDRAYHTFEEGYAAAQNGDTIRIFGGNFEFNNFIVKKRLYIEGVDFPVFSGSEKNQILLVKADSVVIRGIKFINSGTSFIDDNAAIKLDSVHACLITENEFVNNFFGIYLAKSYDCKISNNTIVSNKQRETFSGNGIHLWYCRDIEISNNNISGHRDGIYFEFVRAGKIINNVSKNNLRYGLHFMFSDSCYYGKNQFMQNGAGVAVMYTRFITMENNIFKNNWGNASYGLLLKEIFDSKIINNYFLRNTSGIYLEGCDRIEVRNNIFKANGWGIKLMGNSIDNKFTKNDFINNTFDLTTNNMKNFNFIDENYWSRYNAYDLDRDGYADEPYHPVQLFSVIAAKNASLFIFVRSMVVEMLDFLESVIPTLTPENVVDKKPVMHRINSEDFFGKGK